MVDFFERSLIVHQELRGKIGVVNKIPLTTRDDLSVAYTPGVARPCEVIAEDPSLARVLTLKSNTVAIVSDGSAVLGLGNIGALAAIPVMEGEYSPILPASRPFRSSIWTRMTRFSRRSTFSTDC